MSNALTIRGRAPAHLYLAATMLAVVTLGGGSSWPGTLSLIYVRPLLILLASIALILPTHRTDDRTPALLPVGWMLAALAIWIALQLFPLPPVLWRHLPGHDLIAAIDTAAGITDAWRPISIAPDATLNALLACIPAAAALVLVMGMDDRARRALVPALLILVVASALFGAVQLMVGGNAAAMLYRRTDMDTAVGPFANRNHFALLLSCGLPLLAAWVAEAKARGAMLRMYLAGLAALVLLVMVIATGSRAGLGLGVAGAVAGGAIWWHNAAPMTAARLVPPGRGRARTWRRRLPVIVIAIVVVAVLAATIVLKGLAVERVFGTFTTLGAEKRAILTPVMLAAIGGYMPFGAGFGTFDRLFRRIEPDWALTPTYFNHAHNEALELILTGGVPAALIALAFLTFVAVAGWRALSLRAGAGAARAQAATTAILLMFAASLVDYPLRTPLMDVVLVFALALAVPQGRIAARQEVSERVANDGKVALDDGRR